MSITVARGLTADWLNAWLAAIGITVLTDSVGLSWTREPRPQAQLVHQGQDIAGVISASLPSCEELQQLAIARQHPDAAGPFARTVTLDAFAERAALARARGDLSLSSCVTDLVLPRDGQLEHSPLDPPAPKGKTLWDRVVACRQHLGEDPELKVLKSLNGTSGRVKLNGLGFDHKRFLSPADPVGDVWVDPLVELLASVGMSLIYCRGDGHTPSFRGWAGPGLRIGSFTWPVWSDPVGVSGIDAILDLYWARSTAPGVFGSYASVPYRPRGAMDQTRGYASRPIR